MFSLYTAPAINLFEKTTDRIAIRSNQHEYHVVPDRSRYLDFEPHRILDVYAHYPGGQDKIPVHPLYSASLDGGAREPPVSYTVRRLPRRRTVEEKRYGLVVRLHRHRHVHLAGRAGRHRRRGADRRAERAGAVLEPAPDRASAGRTGRRRLPPARQRDASTSSASPGRPRRASRWSRTIAAAARPRTPARSPGGSSTC